MQQKFPYEGKIVSQAENKISPPKEIFFPPIEKGKGYADLEYLCTYSRQVHKHIFNKNHKNPFIGLEALPEPFVPSVMFLSLRKD